MYFIPNHKIDLSVIKTTYNGKKEPNKYIVELPVSYENAENPDTSAIIKAEIYKALELCSLTIAPTPSIFINYKDSYVGYSFFVITNTIEDNFKACTEVKESLMQNLAAKDIHIPFNVLDVNIKEGICLEK